jgi:hypothetical protein
VQRYINILKKEIKTAKSENLTAKIAKSKQLCAISNFFPLYSLRFPPFVFFAVFPFVFFAISSLCILCDFLPLRSLRFSSLCVSLRFPLFAFFAVKHPHKNHKPFTTLFNPSFNLATLKLMSNPSL